MSGTALPPAVTFAHATWVQRYPEFGSISPELAQLYFDEAGLYVPNYTGGPICNLTTLTLLMNMVTAHIAKLNAPGPDGQPASDLVGRITDATQGSVSVAAEMPGPETGSAAWFNQTKYGAAAYQAMAPYRMARFYPSPRRNFSVSFPGSRWF